MGPPPTPPPALPVGEGLEVMVVDLRCEAAAEGLGAEVAGEDDPGLGTLAGGPGWDAL